VTKEIVWYDASEEEKFKITHAGSPRDAEGKLIGRRSKRASKASRERSRR
jgi:hypothetical protein